MEAEVKGNLGLETVRDMSRNTTPRTEKRVRATASALSDEAG